MRVLKLLRPHVLTAVCALTLASPAFAAEDELLNQINDAIKLYNQGQFSQAATELDLAAQQMRMKQGDQLKNVFPEPLTGWKAELAEANTGGGAMMGGGVTSSKVYLKQNASKPEDSGSSGPEVRIELIKDSPVISSLMMVISNPMYMGAQGGKSVKIGSYRGMLQQDGGESSVQLVIANKVLLSVKGQGGATEADVMAYSKSINFALLEKLCAQ